MKKIISVLLSVSMLLGTAMLMANAATVDDSTVGAHKFVIVDKTTLGDCQARFYTYNFTDNNPQTGVRMVDTTQHITKDFYFNGINGYKQISLNGSSIIEHWFILDNGMSGTCSARYDKTRGTYEKIRIKLSDYSDYFNSDGTHTHRGFNYNFTTQKAGECTYGSALMFWSGGIFTAVTPSKDGYVEFYVSKNIGAGTLYFADFEHKTSTSNGGGGGVNGGYFNYFTMGNANVSINGVSVDDVTAIQSYSAGIVDFDNLQKRNADVNFDGKIDVDDATMVQKYLAGYDV